MKILRYYSDMNSITIEIPKKILERGGSRKLVAVDPKEFEKELRMRWEIEDVRQASKQARKEVRKGTAREVRSLRELMR